MSDTTATWSTLVQRVVAEHRRVVYVLVAGLIVNIVVFAFLIYPLQREVANVEQRTRRAEEALAAAQADYTRTSGTLTGKDRAVKELDTFYTNVLAQDLAGARRLTFVRLAELAEESGVTLERRKYEPVVERGSSLTRLKINMDLRGDYADIRDFIYAIETAEEFVVIDTIRMAEGTGDMPLRVTLELSTYFRSAVS